MSTFGDRRATNARTKGEEQQSSITNFVSSLPTDIKDLLNQSIVSNSTAFEEEDDGKLLFIGTRTEAALLNFARDYLEMGSVYESRAKTKIVEKISFDSGRISKGVLVEMDRGRHRLLFNGLSENLLDRCTKTVASDGSTIELTPDMNAQIKDSILTYAKRGVRAIGMIYRDFPSWPSVDARHMHGDKTKIDLDDACTDMTWVGMLGVLDPPCEDVYEAPAKCEENGVFVRMVTGSNIVTARAIADECDIYTGGGAFKERPGFCHLSHERTDQISSKLRLLARASPKHKRDLVRHLKELGVAAPVMNEEANDAPGLKAADVGFSMGIAGTEVVKEASEIILMDDNFGSIIKALMYGRAINDAVKLLFQTSTLVSFVSAVAFEDKFSILTALQLIWVNFIMDTFAALALSRDPPSPSILDRKPVPKPGPSIGIHVWEMLLGPGFTHVAIPLILYLIAGMMARRKKSLEYVSDSDTFEWEPAFQHIRNELAFLKKVRGGRLRLTNRQSGQTGLRGILNGKKANVFADSGSAWNIMEKCYAERHNITIDESLRFQRLIPIANGRTMRVIGRATAYWSFEDDTASQHPVHFEIVQTCLTEVLFGNPFLRKVRWMAKAFSHRLVKMNLCPGIARNFMPINSIGCQNDGLRVTAFGKGRKITMGCLSDTGAAGNVLSPSAFRRTGLPMEPSDITFLYPDGTTQRSAGRVKMRVSLPGSSSNVYTTFEVMEGCPYDAILGHDFVFEQGVYGDKIQRSFIPIAYSFSLVFFLRSDAAVPDAQHVQRLSHSEAQHAQAIEESIRVLGFTPPAQSPIASSSPSIVSTPTSSPSPATSSTPTVPKPPKKPRWIRLRQRMKKLV